MGGTMLVFDGWSLLLLGMILLHLAAAPFTKVEESFNMQAAHDLLLHGSDLDKYDHHMFPGVVPRTFTGAAALAAFSWPWVKLSLAAGLPKLSALYVVRGMLGLVCAMSLFRLRRAVEARHGRAAGRWWALLSACQFHLPFYASRLLPNSLAVVLTNLGLAEWLLQRRPAATVALFAFATVVFRGDILLLAGPVGLQMLASGHLGLLKGITWGLASVACSLALTLPLDSLLWGRRLWPEGEVLWFNTVLNKSSEWGIMPAHWYLTSALPRALLGGLPLVPLGLVLDPKSRLPAFAALAFVGLYSLLPHKELRFLLPVLPLFNAVSASALARLELSAFPPASKGKGGRGPDAPLLLLLRRLVFLGAALALPLSLAAAAVSLNASRTNYPGGVALQRLHSSHEKACGGGTVHVGVAAAMTGVSRFGEESGPQWTYSKLEGVPLEELHLPSHGFSCLLSSEAKVPGFELLEAIDGFAGLSVARRPAELLASLKALRMPLEFRQEPKIFILRRIGPGAASSPSSTAAFV